MILESTDMLPIGEDLGAVPMTVRTTMQKLV
jgi:4-alpha-glucanotransferase